MALYTLPELPYDYSALAPVISPEIIELHHDKHHAAYVKGANDTLGFVHELRQQLYMGLGGAQIHGRVMFTSFVSTGVLARTASGCSR
ncbi:hypothetical protein SUDANB176_00192 [Streptomyces sp. enrichment culture]